MYLQLISVLVLLGKIHGNYCQTSPGEPQCLSRFDHDYKVLQKLVELEQRILANDQRDKITEMGQKIKDLERRLSEEGVNVSCRNGWTYYRHSCYAFMNDFKTSWSSALQQCETYGKGSHLVSIETAMEQIFLQKSVKRLAKSAGSKRFYWVGATEDANLGVFVWQATGQLVSDTGAYWYPGQPGSTTQDCACLWGDDDYTLHDWVCEKEGFFICEKGA